jgi:hypothetical protein
VHYYTPWQFVGLTEDASWGKMRPTWGSASDVAELNRLFDLLQAFTQRNDIPAFVGEFGVTEKKEAASRVRWMTAVAQASLERKMVPVLWDTGGDISRKPPYAASPALQLTLKTLGAGLSSKTRSADVDVARDLGAVLGWRLGPGSVVTHCRALDPEGAAARDKLLSNWNAQNHDLIEAVDARIAEVLPLLDSKKSPESLNVSLRDHVSKLVVETTFSGKSGEEARAICQAEADPSRPRWRNTGMRGVQQSLAALYDWKIAHGPKEAIGAGVPSNGPGQ